MCVSAYAGDERIAKKTGNLTFSGTTANCSACVSEAGSNIILNMTLYHDSSVVGTWSTSGKNYVSLDKTCSVDAGEEYMLIISGTISGNSFTMEPITRTCKGMACMGEAGVW